MTASDFETLKAQGNAYLKNKETYKAIDSYSQAAAISPDNHIIFSNRSAAYLVQGSVEAALADAETCLRIAPEWPKAYHRKAAALEVSGRLEDARDTCLLGISTCDSDISGLSMLRVALDEKIAIAAIQGSWRGTVS